jgi:hypothetical protein
MNLSCRGKSGGSARSTDEGISRFRRTASRRLPPKPGRLSVGSVRSRRIGNLPMPINPNRLRVLLPKKAEGQEFTGDSLTDWGPAPISFPMTLLPGRSFSLQTIELIGGGWAGLRAGPDAGPEVALKVLDAEASSNPERLSMFEQEARHAASTIPIRHHLRDR